MKWCVDACSADVDLVAGINQPVDDSDKTHTGFQMECPQSSFILETPVNAAPEQVKGTVLETILNGMEEGVLAEAINGIKVCPTLIQQQAKRVECACRGSS